jgi:predicted nucleic acid-binding protein
MEILSIKRHEAEIAEISENLNLTFYDASYVFAAKSKSAPPITEDSEIERKASNYIRILSVEDLI